MLDIQTQLFESPDIRLGPIDHEKDPDIESKWTHDSEFMRLMDTEPARPFEDVQREELGRSLARRREAMLARTPT